MVLLAEARTFSSEYAAAKEHRREQRRQDWRSTARRDWIKSEEVEQRIPRRAAKLEELANKRDQQHREERGRGKSPDQPMQRYPVYRRPRAPKGFAGPCSESDEVGPEVEAVQAAAPKSAARQQFEWCTQNEAAGQWHVRKAAELLAALAAHQRPAKRQSLLSFLKRNRCDTMWGAGFLEPDALLKALPAGLPDDAPEELHRLTSILAARANPKFAGSEMETRARSCAQALVMSLRSGGFDRFLSLDLEAKLAWICNVCAGKVLLDVAVVADMLAERCIFCQGTDGRLVYDEPCLANSCRSEAEAAAAAVLWEKEDLSFWGDIAHVNVRMALGVKSLGVAVTKDIRARGLARVAIGWCKAALQASGCEDVDVVVDCEAWTEKWNLKKDWGLVIVIMVNLLGGGGESIDSEAFSAELQTVADDGISSVIIKKEQEREEYDMAPKPCSTLGKQEQQRRKKDEDIFQQRLQSGKIAFGSSSGKCAASIKRW